MPALCLRRWVRIPQWHRARRTISASQVLAYGPLCGDLVLRSYLSALEHAGIVLWVSLFVLVANALINYALIFGNLGLPELGLQGAAIASVMAQTLALLGFVIYIHRNFPEQQMFAPLLAI